MLPTIALVLCTTSLIATSITNLQHFVPSFENRVYLAKRIFPEDHRFTTFLLALNLMTERGAKTLVETGTARLGCSNCKWDGCSTLIFAHFAKDNGADFYSVDISQEAIAASKEAVESVNPDVHFTLSDSIAFLKNFDRPIDFLYLDSYEFDPAHPLPCQLHHLYEIQAAYPFLHENSFVLIDDCDLPHGGKGKLAIEWLLEQGWRIEMSGYQVLLVP